MKYILKDAEPGYLPTVEIAYYKHDDPNLYQLVEVDLALKRLPTDAEFDYLRLALRHWASQCGYGELKHAEDVE